MAARAKLAGGKLEHRIMSGLGKYKGNNFVAKRRPFSRILLVGANGYPGMTYEPFLNDLSERTGTQDIEVVDYHKVMAEEFSEGWTNWEQAKMMVYESLKGRDLAQEAVARKNTLVIGHSLGASLVISALRRGGASGQRLCLIDPPYFALRTRMLIELSLRWRRGIMEDLISASAGRQDSWANRTEAMAHLSKVYPLRNFSPTSLRAFEHHGLVEIPDGAGGSRTVLEYPKEVESGMFACTPTELPRLPWLRPNERTVGLYDKSGFASGESQMQSGRGLFLFSRKMEFARAVDVESARSDFYRLTFQQIDNHFAPFTHHEQLAQTIHDHFLAETLKN